MLGFGALAFATPWVLAALAVLPVIWWLLRATPPAPRRLSFPAIRLLFNLRPKEETPAKTPWWLLLLRLCIAALVILALAQPLLNPVARTASDAPLFLVVDDGWAAARHWPARQTAMLDLIDRAERDGRSVVLLSTAPGAAGDPVRASGLLRAADARSHVQAMTPQPWPVDREAALAAVEEMPAIDASRVVWLSDGLADGAEQALAERLQRIAPVEVITDAPADLARLLLPPAGDGADLVVTVLRADAGPEGLVWVRASGEDGRLLGREAVRLPPGEPAVGATLNLPTELRNRVTRLEIEAEATAGAAVLLDERWRRRPVGIVSTGELESAQPLLSEIHYLDRALRPFSEVRHGSIPELLNRELAVLLLPDIGPFTQTERMRLGEFMRDGGVVVRFAGPRVALEPDDFTPVQLRAGDRSLGGAMSWSTPSQLAAFEPSSPFAGLAVPEDVTVSRQVLAEPTIDIGKRSWARLSDGTPLVTAERRDNGWLVLVHTTANPEWSNLPMSGLFVDMLRRLVAVSQGVAGADPEGMLPPIETLDAFGRPQSPPVTATAIAGRGFDAAQVGPRHPPGFYGSDSARRALNLASSVPELRAIAEWPAGVSHGVFTAPREVDLKPFLLALALGLLIVDLVIGLALRGLLTWRRATAGLALLVLGLGLPSAEAQIRERGADDGELLAAVLETRLAYVRTGNPEVDATSQAGLAGLGRVLTLRTSVEPAEPMEVDLELDELSFFPLIYWPISAEQPQLSAEAVDRVSAYLRNGGVMLIDTRDQQGYQGGGSGRLREIVGPLSIPPLQPVPPDHVLTKAFYLLHEYPGRWTGGTVWVEETDERINDGVSSVIIGGNDWAGAWAMDQRGRPMYAVVPGGERQREMAYRFGVNLVMYALTGNYKADQVHIPAILERLGQ